MDRTGMKRAHNTLSNNELGFCLVLLSAYMKYLRESIGFIPKKLKIFFYSKHFFFYLLKVIKRENINKNFRPSRAAAVDKNLCHAYSLDHKN
jgi:hypothetical protein